MVDYENNKIYKRIVVKRMEQSLCYTLRILIKLEIMHLLIPVITML